MVDAESKIKKGRKRHCYPRKEVYHRWIHSPEYVYAAHNCLVSGISNYLFINNIGRFIKEEDIKSQWFYRKDKAIAVIDRDTNKICISRKYYLYKELLSAIPEYYEIFWCDKEIPSFDILSLNNSELLYKQHLKCCIQYYVQNYLFNYYASLEGKLTLNDNIDKIDTITNIYKGYINYSSIINFVNKYKIKQYSWYKESLNSKFTFNLYFPKNYSTKTISIPSVKQIVNNTIFTNKEKTYLRKKYFYTKYCYGRGIKFKDVDKYWNKQVKGLTYNNNLEDSYYDLEYKDIVKFFKSCNLYWLPEYENSTCITWNDYVIRSNDIEELHHKRYVQENIALSEKNREEAKKLLASTVNNDNAINAWRKREHIKHDKITYKQFYPPRNTHSKGLWKPVTVYTTNFNFENVQLKLVGNKIITSRNASVPLSSAIDTFKLFEHCKNINKNTGKTKFEFSNGYKVGIYKLSDIQFCKKYTDNNKELDYDSWLIRIGCHNIWIDDVMNFIQYYHLEDKFFSNTNNK